MPPPPALFNEFNDNGQVATTNTDDGDGGDDARM